MPLAEIFWTAVLIPLGIAFGMFLSSVFFGIDWSELIHGPAKDD